MHEAEQYPRVKAFLNRMKRNSPHSAQAYLQAITRLQEFLNTTPEYKTSVNELANLVSSDNVNVYDFLDRFVSYLSGDCKLSSNTVSLYVAAVRGYLEDCDIEISQSKFKRKVKLPKNHRKDEAAIDDADIRKMLLACNNFRLKVYLLLLLDDDPSSLEEPELGNSLGASALVQPLLIRLNGGAIAWSVITPEAALHVHCPGSGQAAAA
jgi:integrase